MKKLQRQKAKENKKGQEFMFKALNEVVNGLNVPFIGDRISLRKEVDRQVVR